MQSICDSAWHICPKSKLLILPFWASHDKEISDLSLNGPAMSYTSLPESSLIIRCFGGTASKRKLMHNLNALND